MQTPLGNQSVKPKPGRYYRRHLRMEHAAQLEASGQFSNNEIAHILNISVPTLHQIKAQPEYLAKRAELATGIVSDLNSGLRQDTENLRRELQDMLPTALRTLRNAVQRGAKQDASVQELKTGMDAAREIMDRESTFAKISKSEIKIREMPDLTKEEQTEVDLLAVLKAAQEMREADAKGIKQDTQTVTLESFVNKAGSADAQERMKQFIKLEDFDSDIRQ